MATSPERLLILCVTNPLYRSLSSWLPSLCEECQGHAIFCERFEDLWKLVVDHQPTLIVAESQWNEMGGLDLLALISASGEHSPVLLITDHAEDEFRNQAWNLGAAGVIESTSPEFIDVFKRQVIRRLQSTDLIQPSSRSSRFQLERNRDLGSTLSELSVIHRLTEELEPSIATLRSCAELLGVILPTELSDARQALDRMNRAAGRLLDFTNEMEQLSDWLSQNPVLHAREFSLRDIVTDSIRNLSRRAKAEGIELALGTIPEAKVEGDSKLIAQLLEYLLLNAIESSSESSTVKLRGLQTADDWIVLEILDSGRRGLPSLNDARYTGSRLSEVGNGTLRSQVRLEVVRRIAAAHGGRVEIATAGNDLGTTVSVHLPRTGMLSGSPSEGSILLS